ncbi:MAG: hypothetical protein ACHQ1D_07445 [Nitrososphaerales archaeon]
MKQLRPLIILAILANLVTIVLYNYMASLPGGSGIDLMFALVWMPAVWIITIITTIIILVIQRKYLFQKSIVGWTVLTLVFATPFPAIACYYVMNPTPETRSDGMSINIINGKIYKTESWEKTASHKKFAIKRFVADPAQRALYGDKAYKKDSTWVYYNNYGDTLKLEYYKNDSLIETKRAVR